MCRNTAADVTWWCHHSTSAATQAHPRQQPRKHIHVSMSHVSPLSSHVSSVASLAPRHLAGRWPGLTRPELHGFDPLALIVDFDLGQLTLTFALTFDQKSNFPTWPILLSFLRKFQFWTPFLHLKLQNWSIGTFFIVVSSKAFFTTSSRDLFVLIQPQAFIELPPWVWGRVLEIYIRHISPM